MAMKIDRDTNRFREIVRGKIRQNLKKYVTNGEMIGRKGLYLVSIPVPSLDVPHFRYGKNGSGGVGQGEGEVGQPVGRGDGEEGSGRAGSDPFSRHVAAGPGDRRAIAGRRHPARDSTQSGDGGDPMASHDGRIHRRAEGRAG